MKEGVKKKICPDCDFCQMCSESRCRLCRNTKRPCKRSLRSNGFTLSEYEEWQKNRAVKRRPVIDIRRCTGCGSCLELAPEVFIRNIETKDIEVANLSDYPEDMVDGVIGICPERCIKWG